MDPTSSPFSSSYKRSSRDRPTSNSQSEASKPPAAATPFSSSYKEVIASGRPIKPESAPAPCDDMSGSPANDFDAFGFDDDDDIDDIAPPPAAKMEPETVTASPAVSTAAVAKQQQEKRKSQPHVQKMEVPTSSVEDVKDVREEEEEKVVKKSLPLLEGEKVEVIIELSC